MGKPCPWSGCTFCNHDSFIPFGSLNVDDESFSEEYVKVRSRMGRRYNADKFFAYFQSGTSTCGHPEDLRRHFSKACALPGIVGLVVSTRPDYIDRERIEVILDAARDLDEVWIELGLQSVHDSSLALLNRGHDSESYFSAVDLIGKMGCGKIKVAPHVILGVPGETEEMMLETVVKSIEPEVVKGIKFHHLQVHNGTALAKSYRQEPFELFSSEGYMRTVAKCISSLPSDITVLRLVTTSPGTYLLAPKWNITMQNYLLMFEKYMADNGLFQGKEWK